MFYTLISQVQLLFFSLLFSSTLWRLRSFEVEGDKGSGDTSTVDVQTLGNLIEHVCEICVFH